MLTIAGGIVLAIGVLFVGRVIFNAFLMATDRY
jgi:hypothetical protein